MKKVILISGKGRHGKDSTAEALRRRYEEEGKRVLIYHFADPLKMICENAYHWTRGDKGPVGRTILQHTGDIYRSNKSDCWVKIAKEFVLGCPEEVVIIPDCRYPNETNVADKEEIITLFVNRPVENDLTEEQRKHSSENAMNDYDFDFYIENDGTLEDLEDLSFKLYELIEQRYKERGV